MFTTAKQMSIAGAFGLIVLALATPAWSQGGFHVGQGLAMTGNHGGRAFAGPGAAGFQVQGGTVARPPAVNPLGNLVANPYGVPVATMSSTPYYPDYGGYAQYILVDPYGGYLRGAASVIDAQGRYLINLQQAYLMQEQLKRARLETRRAAYEEWLWERANLPTLEDERERIAREQLRRAQNDPPLPEIWSGEALNTLLKAAQSLPKTVPVPDIPLDADVVSKINLNSGKAGINFGLLKNEGKLSWPLSLQELKPAAESQDLRDHIQRLARQAFDQAKNGQVDPNTIRELEKSTDRLQKMLVAQVGDMAFAQYSEAKRYLNQLYDGIKALREPNASDIASGKFRLKGSTVAEVVDYMTKNGLQFAPAVAGEEAAYVAMQKALASYGAALSRMTAQQR